MENKYKIKRTIPSIINAIQEAKDSNMISYYENVMVSMYSSVLLFIGAIANFIVRYLIQSQNLYTWVFDSLVFLIIGIAFEVIVRINLKTNMVTLIISSLCSLTLILISVRFYDIIGPAVWTVSFIQLLMAMIRITKVMLYFVASAILISNIYILYHSFFAMPFQMGIMYYAIQIVLFIIVCIISAAVHKVSLNRYHFITKQFEEVIGKNDEITSLYEEIASSEQKAKELAYHDHLTGIHNRLYLSEKLNNAVILASTTKKMLALMFLDLDDFKKINDTKGHDVGDQLLVEVSKRLVNTVRKSDTVARIGGDEFIILIEDVENEDYINTISGNILKCFSKPFRLDEQEHFVATSIGITMYPRDGESAEVLIKNADIAMYKAKAESK